MSSPCPYFCCFSFFTRLVNKFQSFTKMETWACYFYPLNFCSLNSVFWSNTLHSPSSTICSRPIHNMRYSLRLGGVLSLLEEQTTSASLSTFLLSPVHQYGELVAVLSLTLCQNTWCSRIKVCSSEKCIALIACYQVFNF